MATKKSTYEVKKSEETVETSVSLFEAESEPVEKPESASVKTVRKYDPEDMIPCRSVTNGCLYITGNRSNFGYVWADYGDVVDSLEDEENYDYDEDYENGYDNGV